MTISAPAKLNLSLRIRGKRLDGYHEVETLMVPLRGLADRLGFEKADQFALEVDGADVGAVEGQPHHPGPAAVRGANRAALSLPDSPGETRSGRRGAGGRKQRRGGDPAGAQRVGRSGLEGEVLESLGAELGSDVPFFLRSGPCWCGGRGEQLSDTEVASFEVLLLKPAFGVSTPDAYRRWTGAKELAGIDYGVQLAGGVELVNDLERPVFEKFLFLAELKNWLRQQDGVQAALMSGSGATVFAVLGDPSAGRRSRRGRGTSWILPVVVGGAGGIAALR